MKIILLFSFVFILHLQLTMSVPVESTSLSPEILQNTSNLVRKKRQLLSILAGASSVASLAGVAGALIPGPAQLFEYGKRVINAVKALFTSSENYPGATKNNLLGALGSLKDIKIKFDIINKNGNENGMINQILSKEHPEWGNFIHFSKEGFKCNKAFCKKYGDGNFGVGICTPVICVCASGKAEEEECNDGLIYDVVTDTCDYPSKIPACGS